MGEGTIESLSLGPAAVSHRTEPLPGAGSPEAQVIVIGRLCDLEAKKTPAKRLASIKHRGMHHRSSDVVHKPATSRINMICPSPWIVTPDRPGVP